MSGVERSPGDLERAVIASIDAHGEIPEKYAAVKMLSRLYAANIDEAVATDTEIGTKALYLGPHLLNTLKLLDLAPADAAGGGKSAKAPSFSGAGSVMKILESLKKENGT